MGGVLSWEGRQSEKGLGCVGKGEQLGGGREDQPKGDRETGEVNEPGSFDGLPAAGPATNNAFPPGPRRLLETTWSCGAFHGGRCCEHHVAVDRRHGGSCPRPQAARGHAQAARGHRLLMRDGDAGRCPVSAPTFWARRVVGSASPGPSASPRPHGHELVRHRFSWHTLRSQLFFQPRTP